jgi:colanic acid biosynthesis glycosyl transferase WcaI
MRVLILSQYYDPEPLPKPAGLAAALATRGHRVGVLTGFPNYPTGRIYPGFRLRPVQRCRGDACVAPTGVPVTRAYEFPYHGKGVLGRAWHYGSFMLTAPLASLLAPRCDVIYVWHPPLTVGIAAWIIGRMRRVPFVYDVQDIWPESIVASGYLKSKRLVRLLSGLERFVYRRADHLLVVTEEARQNLVAKGVPPGKVSVMPHWVDETLFAPRDETARARLRAQWGWDGRFVVLFAGNLGAVQGLDTVLTAADQLADDEDVRIVLLGDGTEKSRLQQICRRRGLDDRVQFVERQPMAMMPEFMAAADALLVHLKESEISRYSVPTKTYAYLAAGKPILMAMEGAAGRLVRDAGAGIVLAAEDPCALAEAIRSLRAMAPEARAALGRRGREYLLAHLSQQRVIARYEELLERVARPKRRAWRTRRPCR